MQRISGLRALAVVACAAGLTGACGGDSDSSNDAPRIEDDAPLIESATYYHIMGVGDFATMPDESLDDIGEALCSDMRGLVDDATRRGVVLVLREQTASELEAFTVALAVTGRHCPEYFHLWDSEVEEIMGGDLPW